MNWNIIFWLYFEFTLGIFSRVNLTARSIGINMPSQIHLKSLNVNVLNSINPQELWICIYFVNGVDWIVASVIPFQICTRFWYLIRLIRNFNTMQYRKISRPNASEDMNFQHLFTMTLLPILAFLSIIAFLMKDPCPIPIGIIDFFFSLLCSKSSCLCHKRVVDTHEYDLELCISLVFE